MVGVPSFEPNPSPCAGQQRRRDGQVLGLVLSQRRRDGCMSLATFRRIGYPRLATLSHVAGRCAAGRWYRREAAREHYFRTHTENARGFQRETREKRTTNGHQ